MNYELAKQLKDAGFPQDYFTSFEFWIGEKLYNQKTWAGGSGDFSDIFVKKPTLSELIEACGDNFDNLKVQRTFTTKWFATGNVMPGFVGYGPTPKEAVAKLWLKINNPISK